MKTLIRTLAAIAALSTASQLSATLIGDSVTSLITPTPFWQVSDSSDPYSGAASASTVVGAGVEFFYNLDFSPDPRVVVFEADIDATSITLTNIFGTIGLDANEIIRWEGLGWPGGINGFSLTTSGTSGIDSSDISFGSDWIEFNISDNSEWSANAYAIIDLARVPDSGSSALLLGLAVTGLVAFKTSRRRR